MPLVLTDEARDDLDSIAIDGLLNWGKEQAERYHARIAELLDSLAAFPRLGWRQQDFAGEVRAIAVGHHRIFNRVENEAVRVLRILYERMDVGRHLDG